MELLKSWLLLACVAGTFAAPFAGWGSRQCSKIPTCESDLARYEEGKTYIYNYHAESSTWINGTSNEKSALVFDLQAQIDVISPCELTLKLKEVDVLETGSDGQTTPARNQGLLRSELQDQVLRFAFHEGMVTNVCPAAGETTWALNFKRGFLSAIQDPVTGSLLSETGKPTVVTETDVTGKCSATFSTSENSGVVTKVKDFKNCEHRTKLEGGIQATLLRADAPLFDILECSQKCEIAYKSNVVSESSCVEQHTSKPFAREGAGAMTVIKASVDNLRITMASKTPSSSMIERQTTIFFEHEETKGDTQPEIIRRAEEILGMLSRKLVREVGMEMPNLFSSLVTEMKKIETLNGMTQLREFVESQSEGLVEVFRDALQMCETTPSIETMVTIIKEVAASEDEAVIKAFKATRAMWLTQPAVIRHPTKQMIGSLMPVIKTLSVDESVFFLPISSMINKYCTTENPSCLEDSEVRMAIEFFQQLLGFDCTPTEEVPTLKMLMALKALTNIRRLTTDSKITIINKCFDIHNQHKRTEVRVAALDLVRRLPCKPEYQTYALAMYKNQHFDSELRIAAYRAIMSCPSENIMAAISEVMQDEQSEQVGSYVWTHLSNLNETSDPQKLSLKKWVQDSGVFASFSKVDPRKFSRNIELSWYNDEMGSGLTLDGDMIFSAQSFLPRQMKLNTTVNLFGYAINLFEVGGRLEGMHQFLEKYLGPQGFFKQHSLKELMEDYQQKQQESLLNEISDPGVSELPEGLPQGVTPEMYNKLLKMLNFQKKLFGGQVPLPIPGEPMPRGMPEGMTQKMYDELLLFFIRGGLPGSRKRRHLVKDSDINNIHSSYPAHVEDKPDASMYFKMFGSELGYLDIEKIKTRFTEMQSSVNPLKILINLAKEQTHELIKNAVLTDNSWSVPTVIGLPLKLAVNGTVSMKVRTSGKVDIRGFLMPKKSFEISGIVEPSAAVEISTSMEVMARTTRSGLNHVGRLQSSVSLSGKIQFTNGKAFELKLDVPEEKQNIIDVSSSIYLRRQDESYAMPGIPERLELSYCSGSGMTKYFGVQLCSELAFPKSYARKGTPMYPLTGPGRMLVTIEKTDPSLTSWKIEGSYDKETESVNNVVEITDRLHLMVGAPDTDNPRTFQFDFTFNRNEKDLNVNIISPFKTVDLHGTLVNEELLRKLEVTLTMDKTNVYTLDAEVESRPEVVDMDPVINFYPRMDITSPSGNVLKYRSSIAVRDGDQTRVALWMSLDSPKSALVTISGDVVKTESAKKLRYSSDLQISGRYVNLNVSGAWQKQKRDNIITLDATALRRVNGEIVKEIVMSTKYTNKSVEGSNEWDMKTEWLFSRYPLLSFLFETEYSGRSGHSESTSKLCYRYSGEECSQDTKVVMGHLLTWESSESSLNEVLNFKLRNPANNINIEIQQRAIRNETHPVDFSFTILNNTSEKQIIQAVLSTHTALAGPSKGGFEASLSSQTWRYAAVQGWEYVKSEKLITNTALHWGDQMATLALSYIPKSDVEMNLQAHNVTSVLTYPLGSLSTSWFVWMKDSDVSSGASMFLIDQQLFGYRVDFTNRGAEGAKDRDLVASFNVTSPASPISITLDHREFQNDVDFGFNITMGATKVFASGINWAVTAEDSVPRTDANTFVMIDIPRRDYRLMYSASSMMTAYKHNSMAKATLNDELFFSQSTDYEHSVDYETSRSYFTYETSQNMSNPLPDISYKVLVSIRDGNHDHQVNILRNKQHILFAQVKYDRKEMENEVVFDRHDVKFLLRTPLAVCKDVSWNATLDVAPATFNLDTRLMYFPKQERPLGMVVNFLDKSNNMVTHKDLKVTLQSTQRTVTFSNMAKFDLDAGTVKGASSVEFGATGVPTTEKFEVSITYTNDTRLEEKSHSVTLLLISPDNRIQTDSSVVYTMDTSVSTSFSIAVPENTLFSFNVLARDESDSTQKMYNVDTNVELLEHQYRLHTVYNEAANSFNPNVKLYRGSEPNPIAEFDLSYTKVSLLDEVHTTILVLRSEDFQPLTITTVYNYNTNSKEVSLTIEPSEGKNVKFDFNILAGSSKTESLSYDSEFSITNTYLPERSLVVVTHFGKSDTGHNLNVDLQISESRMMNFMCDWIENEPKTNVEFQLTFPQMTEYPTLSKMKLRLGSEDQSEAKLREAAFLWGELTDDEMVSVALTMEADEARIVLIQPMDLLLLPKETRVVLRRNSEPTARMSFDINVMDNMDETLVLLAGSHSLIDSQDNNQRVQLTLSRRDHPDIQASLDMAVKLEDAIFRSSMNVKYSDDENKLVEAMLQVVNTSSSEGVGYDLDVSLRHPITNVDMSTSFNFLNDKKAMILGMEGEVLLVEGIRPYTFEIKWDKAMKKYSLTSNTPDQEILLTGQFEDRSYSEHKIYRVNMVNSLNGKDFRSMFDFNSQSKEVSYTAHINPEQPADFMRFKAGYLNETALFVLLDSDLDGEYTVDARLLESLPSARILRNQLEWRPEWAEFVHFKAAEILHDIRVSMQRNQEYLLENQEGMSELFQTSLDDFLQSNADVKTAFIDMKDKFSAKFDESSTRWSTIREDFNTKWADYWEQFKLDSSETIEEMTVVLNRLRERFSTLTESLKVDGSEYIQTLNERVKTFYANNIAPLVKELKMLFESLIENHNSQMDLLFPIRHPYGDDALLPKPEPEVLEPKYETEGDELFGAKEPAIFLTSIKDVKGETVLSEDTLLSTMTRERLRRLELVQNIERLWNSTKEEIETVLAEIDTAFKGSAFYADLTENWDELMERFPVDEWRQEIEAKIEEIRESQDVQRLISVFNEIKEEIELSREASNENILRIQEKIIATLKEYQFDILNYFKYPMYEVVKYDVENGEIIILFHLPYELHSLQAPPESYRQVQAVQRFNEMIAEVRERSKNTLGEIRMADGTLRSMYELMFTEPMLLFREGNFTAWFQGEKIKMQRNMWNAVHVARMYLNPINWLPPHEANAVIIGSNHFVTYDRTFYDFSSGCSYLLAHDFIDGNFTVIVDYERDLSADGRSKSIVLYLNDTDVFEIKQDFTVSHGKQFLEMPFQHGRTTVMRYINSIRIHNTNGITITCEIAQDICTVDINGWYYGKTAGLFGTYNYNDLDDMTNSEGEMSRHLDEFTRSWKVGKRCSASEHDSLPECNADPQVEENALCAEHFLNEVSSLTQCLGVVDPAPYYAMCASSMCQLTADDRKEAVCVAVKAYVNECNRMMVGITVPKSCVVCDSPVGEYIQDEIRVLSEPEEIPRSADVILIVEEKECNRDMMEKVGDIIDMYDTELKNVRQFTDNRFGIVGFGGEGLRSLPHIQTIDGALFNEKRPLRMQGFAALVFAEDGSNNTFDAILAAANYPFRAGVAKNIILLSCSDCQRMYHMEKTYADVSSMLMRQGIQFNMLMKADLKLVPTRAKNNSPKNQVIYGIDNRTVFTNKALSSGTLFGDKTIRKLINEPISQCALLAYETGGAVFDSAKISEKKFVDVLTQRMVEHTEIEECQICSCKAYNDGVGRSVCESCDIATGPNWYFEMQRTFAEADYYSRLGLQTVVDYINEQNAEVPVNKTPKKI